MDILYIIPANPNKLAIPARFVAFAITLHANCIDCNNILNEPVASLYLNKKKEKKKRENYDE